MLLGPRLVVVPLRAVAAPLEPAGGAALQAALRTLTCWPTLAELNPRCSTFVQQASKAYGISVAPIALPPLSGEPSNMPLSGQLPPQSAVAAAATAAARAAAPGATTQPGARSPGGPAQAAPLPGAGPAFAPGAAGMAGQGQHARPPAGAQGAAGPRPHQAAAAAAAASQASAAAAAAAAAALPPEGFSRPVAQESCDSWDDPMLAAPIVLTKTVVVQGRTAVAVSSGSSASTAVTGALATANGLGRENSHGSSGGGAGPVPQRPHQLHIEEESSAVQIIPVPVSASASRSSSGRAGSATGAPRYAFALNGKLYDARGNELPPEAAGQPESEVMELGDVPLQRLSRSNSSQRLGSASPMPSAAGGGGAVGSRVALQPLRHGSLTHGGSGLASPGGPGMGLPAGQQRLGSASGQRPLPGGIGMAAPAAGSAGTPRKDDPSLRAAALAAAMRELGISDLPLPANTMPASNSASSSTGAGAAPGRAPVGGLGSNGSSSGPNFVQYGLPPNYRPSSGRPKVAPQRDPESIDWLENEPGAYEHDDLDFESRLQNQVEANVLKASSSAVSGSAAPGAYLPPRAGAAPGRAPVGGLGARPSPGPSTAAHRSARQGSGSRSGRPCSPTGYPEDEDFEIQLQRQMDTQQRRPAPAPAPAAAGRGAGRGGGAPAPPAASGAAKRLSGGSVGAGAAKVSAAAPAAPAAPRSSSVPAVRPPAPGVPKKPAAGPGSLLSGGGKAAPQPSAKAAELQRLKANWDALA